MPREQLIWTGNVWKAIVEHRTHADVDTAVCKTDRGIGVILKRPNTDRLDSLPHRSYGQLAYGDYIRHHEHWMRPKGYEEILRFIDGAQ